MERTCNSCKQQEEYKKHFTMTKDEIISAIEQRIKSEYRKHPDLDWAGIAARKIYAELKESGLVNNAPLREFTRNDNAEWEDRRVHVSDLDITIRLHELLAMNKINYLNQLCYTTKDELVKYYNFGERSVMELEETMAQNGLLLFGTVPQKINTQQ